jgi:hypothetical protein
MRRELESLDDARDDARWTGFHGYLAAIVNIRACVCILPRPVAVMRAIKVVSPRPVKSHRRCTQFAKL